MQKHARWVCKVGNVHALYVSTRPQHSLGFGMTSDGARSRRALHFAPTKYLALVFLCQRTLAFDRVRWEHALCSASMSRYGCQDACVRRGSTSGEIGKYFRMRIHSVQQWLGGRETDRQVDRVDREREYGDGLRWWREQDHDICGAQVKDVRS